VAVYNAGWSPYGDGGHWVYTDCGWYWDSDYAWGTTFHYGRWFRSPQFGWCWYPDTVWAPSWVMWRSSDDYCGWAPLPPFAVFTPGVGFYYRGVAVGVDFDFGLSADCFLFVGPDHFADRHPHSFFVPHDRAIEVFHHTTIMNHYEVSGHSIVNRGFGTERIAAATHRPVEPVHMGSLPNAGRQGYRGEGFQQTMHPTASAPREARPNEAQGHTAAGPNNQVRSANEAANARPVATTGHQGAAATEQQPARNTATEPGRTTPQTQNQNRNVSTPGGAAMGGAVQERSGVQTQTRQSAPAVSHPTQSQAPARAATQPAPAPGQAQPQAPAKGNQGNNANNKNKQDQ
jgi:hypothetical protein